MSVVDNEAPKHTEENIFKSAERTILGLVYFLVERKKKKKKINIFTEHETTARS